MHQSAGNLLVAKRQEVGESEALSPRPPRKIPPAFACLPQLLGLLSDLASGPKSQAAKRFRGKARCTYLGKTVSGFRQMEGTLSSFPSFSLGQREALVYMASWVQGKLLLAMEVVPLIKRG